jgi:hypothetical protein
LFWCPSGIERLDAIARLRLYQVRCGHKEVLTRRIRGSFALDVGIEDIAGLLDLCVFGLRLSVQGRERGFSRRINFQLFYGALNSSFLLCIDRTILDSFGRVDPAYPVDGPFGLRKRVPVEIESACIATIDGELSR